MEEEGWMWWGGHVCTLVGDEHSFICIVHTYKYVGSLLRLGWALWSFRAILYFHILYKILMQCKYHHSHGILLDNNHG